jgi:hypothetical protein
MGVKFIAVSGIRESEVQFAAFPPNPKGLFQLFIRWSDEMMESEIGYFADPPSPYVVLFLR